MSSVVFPTEYLKSSDAECGERFPHVECSDGRIIRVHDTFYTPSENSSLDCEGTVSCRHLYSNNLDYCYKYAALVIYRRAKALCNDTQKCDSMFADPSASDIRLNCSNSTKACVTFQLTYTCAQDTSKFCFNSQRFFW